MDRKENQGLNELSAPVGPTGVADWKLSAQDQIVAADSQLALAGEKPERSKGIAGGVVHFFFGPPLPKETPASCQSLILGEALAPRTGLGSAKRRLDDRPPAAMNQDSEEHVNTCGGLQEPQGIFGSILSFFCGPPPKSEGPPSV